MPLLSPPLRRPPIVRFEDTSQPFLTLDGTVHVGLVARLLNQLVVETLVIALKGCAPLAHSGRIHATLQDRSSVARASAPQPSWIGSPRSLGARAAVMSQNWIVANLTLLRGSSGSEVRRVLDAARGDRDLGGRWQPR